MLSYTGTEIELDRTSGNARWSKALTEERQELGTEWLQQDLGTEWRLKTGYRMAPKDWVHNSALGTCWRLRTG